MEKSEIKLYLDNEKMCALKFYLKKENATVQSRMDEALQTLYASAVPEPVREYLDAVSAPSRPKRPPRTSQAKTEPVRAASGSTGHDRRESV